MSGRNANDAHDAHHANDAHDAHDVYDPELYNTTSSIVLGDDGRLTFDGKDSQNVNSWAEYTHGLEALLHSGQTSDWVAKELIPYHLDPARIPEQPICEFFSDARMDLFYGWEAVSGLEQVWMHPKFDLCSLIFDVRGGYLSLGNMFKNFQEDQVPGSTHGARSFGGTADELTLVIEHANAKQQRMAHEQGFPRDHWTSRKVYTSTDPYLLLDVIRSIGYEHYDGDLDLIDFMAIVNEAYEDDTRDVLLLKWFEPSASRAEEVPGWFVAGLYCGHLQFGIAAPMVPLPLHARHGNTISPVACMIQSVRFFSSAEAEPGASSIGIRSPDAVIFFRAGYHKVENVMVPHFLSVGRTYYRIHRTTDVPSAYRSVEGAMVRSAVFEMSSALDEEPHWRFAPPIAVLQANGFVVQLPLQGAKMNQERLRKLAMVLRPRIGQVLLGGLAGHEFDIADVYHLSSIPAELGEQAHSTLVHQIPSLKGNIPFTVPKDANVTAYKMGDYSYTVERGAPNLANPFSVKTVRFTPADQGKAVIIPDHSRPVWDDPGKPSELMQAEDAEELHFPMHEDMPNIVKSRSRLGLWKAYNQAKDGEGKTWTEWAAERLADSLEALRVAKQQQDKADAKAEEARRDTERAAAAAAKWERRAHDKAKREKAKERADELKAQKVPRSDEEREDLARRAEEAAARERERVAAEAAEARERERKAREEAKKGKKENAKLSPQEAYKRNQEAKAVAKAQAEKAKRTAKMRITDPNPAAAHPEREAPVVEQVLRDMYEAQPRQGGGKKGGGRRGR